MTQITRTSPTKEAIRLTKLWQQLGPNEYPLDIQCLIDGIVVKSGFQDQLQVECRMFDSFEGALVRTKGTRKWTILLNENIENKRRMRFTFAHELGHFMCHRELQEKFEDSSDTLNDFSSDIELEANRFASWLLMPANHVRDEFSTHDWCTETLCEIGNRFECSLQASALRYVDLSEKPIAFVVSRDGMIVWACKSKKAPFMQSYRFGDELPRNSNALIRFQNQDPCQLPKETGTCWTDRAISIESQYFDASDNGYQYTCIEFIS